MDIFLVIRQFCYIAAINVKCDFGSFCLARSILQRYRCYLIYNVKYIVVL